MRTKTLGGRRKRPRSATPPSLSPTQDEYAAAEFETSCDDDDDLRDVPLANCDDHHSSRSPPDVSKHESINLWLKNVCICCNKGGGVLVCSGKGCPVALHATCSCSEPKFDDFGNFYCPYCWYKRVVDKFRELERKVRKAKEAFSSFSVKGLVMSDKLVQKDEAGKRNEPHDGDEISLGGENGQGIDGVNIQPLQPDGDQPRKLQEAGGDRCEMAPEAQAEGDRDGLSLGGENRQGSEGVNIQPLLPERCEMALEDQADGDRDGLSLGGENRQGSEGVGIQPLLPEQDQPRKFQEADGDRCEIALQDQADGDGDFRPFREEEMPVGVNLVLDSMNQENFDELNKAETDEIIFLKWKESSETEDSGRNAEDVHERIDEVGEEAERLSALHLVKRTDRHSPGIAFAKGTQEIVAKSSETGGMTNKGKIPHREQHESAAGSSVSETNDLDSEDISRRKRHGKRKVQKTAHPQNVASVRKSLLQKHNTNGESPSVINGEVTSSRTRRRPQSLPKQANIWTLLARRNKLFWSSEEEKALQDGVLRFSKENQNIPWRKILESGHHVFDRTRTPVDLKDKWRNMTAKKGRNRK